MAEAAVEDRPLRFFCHVCNVEVQSVSSEYTCPLCSGGFIEELPAVTATTSADSSSTNDIEMDDLDFLATLTSFLSRDGGHPPDLVNADDEGTQNLIRNAGRASSGNGSNNENVNDLGGNANSIRSRSWTRQGRNNINNDIAGAPGQRPRRGRLPNFERFDNVLLEILHTLSGGNDGSLGNASMFFMGNPGDYAWGREGFDTIVTQLLNQMDATGPPPLSKEKIDEIPNFEITKDQVNIKLQCSVCWEDFKLQEIVRKLPCLHLYHENCIVPWLELHGTCPICRKSLIHEARDAATNLPGTTGESASLLSVRERSVDNNSSNSNNSGGELSLTLNGTENNSNNTGNANASGVGARRLHISLPRFTLFGQQDTNRTPVNTFNYDLRINNNQRQNNSGTSSSRSDNLRQGTTTNDMQPRQQPPLVSVSSGIEENNINKFDGSSTSNNYDKKIRNNSKSSNNATNNVPKNSNAVENCDSTTATATTSAVASTSATNSVNNAPQTDVYKFDDGQVDYEFD